MDLTGITGEDEFTELTDATFPRVDLVGKGANCDGNVFLVTAAEQIGSVSTAT